IERAEHAVDAVAGITENFSDAPGVEPFDQKIANSLGHVRTSPERGQKECNAQSVGSMCLEPSVRMEVPVFQRGGVRRCAHHLATAPNDKHSGDAYDANTLPSRATVRPLPGQSAWRGTCRRRIVSETPPVENFRRGIG